MTLTLHLSPDLEQRLVEEATRHGLPVDTFMLHLLHKSLPLAERRAGLGALLHSWMNEEDEGEQKETGEYLIRALDEDRLADRRLFPPESQGQTW